LEIEAKFSIPDAGTFQRLLETATLAGFRLGERSFSHLRDGYWDTPRRALYAAGYACRIREKEGHYLATIKGLGGVAGAVHRREEHEVDLDGLLSPAQWPASDARDLAMRLCAGEPLALLFEIEQDRYTWPVSEADRLVAELNVSHVRVVREGVATAAYRELEAELGPGGREEDLEKLGAELEAVWNLMPETSSKFERSLALVEAEPVEGSAVDKEAPQRLTARERALVERLAQEREVIARRARLLLAWDEGCSRRELIERSGLSPRRTRYWLLAFRQRRLGIFTEQLLQAAALQAKAAALQPVPSLQPEEGHLPGSMPAGEAAETAPGRAEEEGAAAPRWPASWRDLPDRPGIEPDDLMSEAGRKILRYHFRRMLFHEPGTRSGEEIEALHDMRVATRRMRAAFRVFGEHYEPQAVAPYLKGLRRSGGTLGAVRDLDVFRAKTLAYRQTLPEAQRAGLDGFLLVLEGRRDAARAVMTAYLNGDRYRRFVERFGQFVETEGMGGRPAGRDGAEPRPSRVRHVAPMVVYERLAAVRSYDEWVNVPEPSLLQLHALRIACKRLRYTLEFFEEVLGPGCRAICKEVVVLQDHLGNLQDAVVASGLLRDYMIWGTWGHETSDRRLSLPESPVIAPGVAAYLAAKQLELQGLVDTFPQAWQRLHTPEFSRMIAETIAVL